ncbi:hypothetical protein GCM10010193_09110 [Kitasatospora atroaurantiaca]|uniref:Tail protein n=1 Tax=Kitasatospora atroaurantiaca TaxID=285545 RepID=A0A561ERX6_9ACTN|nr:hypothetical protein [Kitasatospora atroaurantiaca]TWE18363.1 hypothetical protein FB465_3430 [Kitasatospora atroaurantiaca]
MAELDEWTCEYDGLVIGSSDSALSLAQVDGLLALPEIRSSDLALVQRDGLWPGDDYLNGRSVTLTVEVYGKDKAEFSKALNGLQAAFRPGRAEIPLRFRFPGLAAGATAFVKARPRKRSAPLDLNFAYGVCNVAVELYATDPRLYADAPRNVRVSTSPTLPAPVTYFTQQGAIPARPVVNVASAKNPVLIDDVTGYQFGVTYTGAFTVDSAAQTVTTSTGADITGLVTAGSVWPEYAAGDHRIRLTSEDATVQATAVLTWREAWV